MHLAAAMNQKHLLRFIKKKMRISPYEIVATSSDGDPMTLSQVRPMDRDATRPYFYMHAVWVHATRGLYELHEN